MRELREMISSTSERSEGGFMSVVSSDSDTRRVSTSSSDVTSRSGALSELIL
jgi:hypothetical protein